MDYMPEGLEEGVQPDTLLYEFGVFLSLPCWTLAVSSSAGQC